MPTFWKQKTEKNFWKTQCRKYLKKMCWTAYSLNDVEKSFVQMCFADIHVILMHMNSKKARKFSGTPKTNNAKLFAKNASMSIMVPPHLKQGEYTRSANLNIPTKWKEKQIVRRKFDSYFVDQDCQSKVFQRIHKFRSKMTMLQHIKNIRHWIQVNESPFIILQKWQNKQLLELYLNRTLCKDFGKETVGQLCEIFFCDENFLMSSVTNYSQPTSKIQAGVYHQQPARVETAAVVALQHLRKIW